MGTEAHGRAAREEGSNPFVSTKFMERLSERLRSWSVKPCRRVQLPYLSPSLPSSFNGRTEAFGSSYGRFESSTRRHFYWDVVQLAERQTLNLKVAGSWPAVPAIF